MTSIPIERLSPDKLKRPDINSLKLDDRYSFDEKSPVKPTIVKKRRRKSTKKGTKKTNGHCQEKKLPMVLQTPSLKNLRCIEPSKEYEDPKKVKEQNQELKDKKKDLLANLAQKEFVKNPEKVLDNEDSFLDFELNDAKEAQDLKDLIEEEMKRIAEEKDHILEFKTHVKKDIKVVFEPIKTKIDEKALDALDLKKTKTDVYDNDQIFSTFLFNIHSNTPDVSNNNHKENEEYSVINEAIKQRLRELEKKTVDLKNFKILVKECLEKDSKFEDEDYANHLDNEFTRVKAEHNFLKTYKTLKEEDQSSGNGIEKLKASIMKETYGIHEAKNNLMEIRRKVEINEQDKITSIEVNKAKEGLKHELIGMMASIRNSNNLIDFSKC